MSKDESDRNDRSRHFSKTKKTFFHFVFVGKGMSTVRNDEARFFYLAERRNNTTWLARSWRETDAFDGEAKRKLLQQLPPFPQNTSLAIAIGNCVTSVCVCRVLSSNACLCTPIPAFSWKAKSFQQSPAGSYIRGHLSSSILFLPLRNQ